MEKGNILIVEDEEKIARVLQLELEYEGYSVTIKHNGTAQKVWMRHRKAGIPWCFLMSCFRGLADWKCCAA